CGHSSCAHESPPSSDAQTLLESEPTNTSLPSSELASESIRPLAKLNDELNDMLDNVGLTSSMSATGASSSRVSASYIRIYHRMTCRASSSRCPAMHVQ